MKDFYIASSAAFILSLTIAFVIGPRMLPFLRRLKQTVREDGPASHLGKNGTPTMGGLIFILSTLAATAVIGFAKGTQKEFVFPLLFMLLFGVVGFLDDYIKVVLKRSLGLRAYQKIVLQLAFAVGLALYQQQTSVMGTAIRIPFLPDRPLELGVIYLPFTVFTIIAIVNSVNLTDGLDGLASGVTFWVSMFFLFGALSLGYGNMAVFLAAVAGGCIGFLRINRYPAKVFMGDVGSMALGGAIAAAAIITNLSLFVPIVGFIYFAESLSVIIQVFSFKTFGKRVFKMSPIHHHFELCGWKETKVVNIFYIVTFILCIAGMIGL